MNFFDALTEAWNAFKTNNFSQAVARGEALLAEHGERADTLNLIGASHAHAGNLPVAEAAFRRAIASDPHFAPALSNFGNLLNAMDRREEAVEMFRAAVACDPGCGEGWNNLALAALSADRPAEALDLLDRALAINPEFVVALFNRATALLALHRGAEAEATLHRLLALAPDHRDALACLGAALGDQGRIGEAEAAYRRELERDPLNKMALNNLGVLLQEQRRVDEALALLERGAQAHPQDALTLTNHANVLLDIGRRAEAARYYRAAAELDPACTRAVSKWMLSARAVCDWTDLPAIEAQLAANIERGLVSGPAPFDLLIHPGLGEAQHRTVAAAYATLMYGAALARPPLVERGRLEWRPGRPLRIGYVSSDYLEHATMRLMGGIFAAHDPGRVAFVCYSTGAFIGPQERTRIEAAPACAGFRDVVQLSDGAAAQLIREDRIDLLVDLKGYTKENRLGIQALRPAPVVVSWLGYPGTLGHPRLADYVIGDPVVTPLAAQADYSEALALMPHCYQPNDDTKLPGPAPSRAAEGLLGDALVFCSFNASYKLSPEGFGRWMELLREVPGSVLWLLDPGAEAGERLMQFALGSGIDPARLVFARAVSQRNHLARLQLADIALDTFPYTSHTTGSDALLAGVPLVTRLGDTFCSRVAASLLTAVGLPELIVPDDAAEQRLVLDLARDGERRAALRRHLQSIRGNCPLFDTAGFTRDLERLYVAMAEQQLRGERAPIVLAPAV